MYALDIIPPHRQNFQGTALQNWHSSNKTTMEDFQVMVVPGFVLLTSFDKVLFKKSMTGWKVAQQYGDDNEGVLSLVSDIPLMLPL